MITPSQRRCLVGLGLITFSGCWVAAAPVAQPVAAPASQPAGAPTSKPATNPAANPGAVPPKAPVAVKPGSEPLPTMDDLKSLYEQAKYPDLLKQLPRVLVLRGKAAEPYNKYELLVLRFETQLHMKSVQPAVSTLNEAQNITDDPKKVNYCKAVVLLIKKSKNLAYQPSPNKKEKPPTIDIVDPDSRQKAIKAMLADELALITPVVKKALDGQSLPAIAEALNSIQGLDVLESAAGAGDDSSQIIADLRSRGNSIMAKTVLRLTTQVDQITKDANTLQRSIVRVPNGNGGYIDQVRMQKRGLLNADYQDLKDAIKACDQIIPNAKGLASATGGNMKQIEDLIAGAEDLKRKADKALKSNYAE